MVRLFGKVLRRWSGIPKSPWQMCGHPIKVLGRCAGTPQKSLDYGQAPSEVLRRCSGPSQKSLDDGQAAESLRRWSHKLQGKITMVIPLVNKHVQTQVLLFLT